MLTRQIFLECSDLMDLLDKKSGIFHPSFKVLASLFYEL